MVTDNPAFEARRLVRGAASAILATQAAGQPFASLVTPATPEPIRAEWDRRVNRKRTAATSPAATQQA